MKNSQTILEHYRAADDESRLYLYLQYRSLRDQFVHIELERYQTRLQEAPASVKKPVKGSFWSRMWAGFAFDKL